MLRIGQHERDSISKQIDVLSEEIRGVGAVAGPNASRNEKLRVLQDKLDELRDRLYYVRGRT